MQGMNLMGMFGTSDPFGNSEYKTDSVTQANIEAELSAFKK